MSAMGLSEMLQCRGLAGAPEANAPMNVDVVHGEVRSAVQGDADAHRNQCRETGCIEPDGKEGHHHGSEGHGVEIVGLDQLWLRARRVQMVTSVQTLTDAVHHPAMSRIGEGLHQHEGGEGNEHIAHDSQR